MDCFVLGTKKKIIHMHCNRYYMYIRILTRCIICQRSAIVADLLTA